MTASPAPEAILYVRAADAHVFTNDVLVRCGVTDDGAATVASSLVRADLRGVDTHGIRRLPGYVDRLRRGLVNPAPKLVPERVAAAAASLDGENGFGFVVATRAMAEAMSIATETGVGVVSVRRSTHFGMAATYVLQAVERGFVALVFTNASPGLPPWGSRVPLLGTSPFAAGAPAGTSLPFVLDISPAVAARGKIRKAAQLGHPIPATWALDSSGRATTDPRAALEGVLLPIGAHKGSGLSMLMDILGGVLSGAGFAGGVGDMYKTFDRPQNVGHFFLALRPDLFISLADYRARMDALVDRIHASDRADGFDEVLMPGELESREEARRSVTGIPFVASQLNELAALAKDIEVDPIRSASTPYSA